MPDSMLEFNYTIFVLGCIGGLLPDILRIVNNRHERDLPEYFGYKNFWLSIVLLTLLGGFAAYLLGAADVKQALAYGFTAPEIFSRFSAGRKGTSFSEQIPDTPGGSTSPEREERLAGETEKSRSFTLREWWAS